MDTSERRKYPIARASAVAQLLQPAVLPAEIEVPRVPYRRESLCTECQGSYSTRFSDMCVDCEADENPMFLYTIYESDEEDEQEKPIPSAPASPSGALRLDLSALAPPRFSFQDYSSSLGSSGSTVLTDSTFSSPYFENADLTPISTPGSFKSMISERKGYIIGSKEPQDYFPSYILPQSFEPENYRTGPIRIPRGPMSDPSLIFTEADTIVNSDASSRGLEAGHLTSNLRSSCTPKD
ncbi:hypothetical protein ABW19_dt0208983 [Dactylella cylindrospora]|nr:hypothetical protein ABW19_dt0208983 [Dactylella cylindrospora]